MRPVERAAGSPDGLPKLIQHLETPFPNAMRMNHYKRKAIAGLAAILFCYSAPYVVYRFIYPGAVLTYVGGHVIRPSFLNDATASPDFTFDSHSRSFGNCFLTGSFVSQSLVTRFASFSGMDIAGVLNDLYYPAARMDHLFSGRYIRFKNVGWVPISKKSESVDSYIVIDPPVVNPWFQSEGFSEN